MLSQAEEAGKCYNMVLELNPKNDTAWWHKARVLYDLGRVEEANRCTEKALEINPHIPKDFHYHGARAKR